MPYIDADHGGSGVRRHTNLLPITFSPSVSSAYGWHGVAQSSSDQLPSSLNTSLPWRSRTVPLTWLRGALLPLNMPGLWNSTAALSPVAALLILSTPQWSRYCVPTMTLLSDVLTLRHTKRSPWGSVVTLSSP